MPAHQTRIRRSRVIAAHLLVPALLLLVAACERDEGPTGPVFDQGEGLFYLGYTDGVERVPTCVKCHASITYDWRGTAHAGALATLQASDHAADTCLRCHTTGWDTSDGRYGADDAWAVGETEAHRFADVQCESCHGPASQHNSLQPGAVNVLGSDRVALWESALCGTCHQGTHHPFLSEWEDSGHAGSHQLAGGFVAGNANCVRCHVGQSFAQWVENGVTDHIVSPSVARGITCVACHAPHHGENPGQLRAPMGQEILCGHCHSAAGVAPGTPLHQSTWEVFTGTLNFAGYPSQSYENSAHTTALGEQSCVACHGLKRPYQGPENPAKTGHTFEVTIEACVGCHTGATDFDLYGVQTATQALIDQLQIKISASGPTDRAGTAYQQARFVLDAAIKEGSLGVHNTRYIQKLLQDAIEDYTPTGS